jgi:hypothetical protein
MTPDEASRRIAYVRSTFALVSGFDTLFVLADVYDRPSFITGAGEHYHLGVVPPQFRPGQIPLALVCAEVLVDRTDPLDEPEFFSFIDSLTLHLQLHVLAMANGLPPELVEADVLTDQEAVADRDFALYQRVANPESWRSL